MRKAFLRSAARRALVAPLVAPLAALFFSPFTGLAGTIPLGSAQAFAVLGYAGVTNTGATQIYGNVGVTPGALTLITGFPSPGTVTGGTILGPGSAADQALLDINTAAIALSSLAVSPGGDLSTTNLGGGRTLAPGVYFLSDATAQLNGTLTLDATGDPNAIFVFQLAFALTTGSGSVVNVVGGNSNTQVYWVVGSQATLGPGSTFAGNILAGTSVVLDSTAKIECGRAFARTASVTMIDNLVSGTCAAQGLGTLPSDFGSLGFSGGGGGGGGAEGAPEPGTFALLAMGLGAGFSLHRNFRPSR